MGQRAASWNEPTNSHGSDWEWLTIWSFHSLLWKPLRIYRAFTIIYLHVMLPSFYHHFTINLSWFYHDLQNILGRQMSHVKRC